MKTTSKFDDLNDTFNVNDEVVQPEVIEKKIDKIKSPLLIISGKNDEVVPHFHSKLLLEKAVNQKKSLFVDEAMHNNLYDFGIEKTVINFSLKIWKLI